MKTITRCARAISVLAILLPFYTFSQSDQDPVKFGSINFSDYDFQANRAVALNGEWQFYWNELIEPGGFDSIPTSAIVYYPVPQKWSEKKDSYNVGLKTHGYATYRLEVAFASPQEDLALKVWSKGLSYKVYINGEIVGSAGQVGTSKESCIPASSVDIIPFSFPAGSSEIIIQTSNFHNHSGGLRSQILIGSEEKLWVAQRNRTWMDLFLAGSIFIMGIYHVGLFFVRKKALSPILFAGFCLLMALRIVVNENFGTEVVAFGDFIHRKVDYLTYYLAFGLFFLYSARIFSKEINVWVLGTTMVIVGLFTLGVILLPMGWYTMALSTFQIITFLGMLYLTYVMIMATIRKRSGARIYLIGWVLLFATGINDLLHFSGIIETSSLIHIGIFLFILAQALLLMIRYERSIIRSIQLSKKLRFMNKNLEKIVDVRTKDLAEKNRSITESISYAERIQHALLPLDSEVKKVLPDSFVLLKPRDLLSGDFYWFTHINDSEEGPISVIVAADSTGNGLSGAIMTMSGSATLSQIVNLQRVISPDQIASSLNNAIHNLLHQGSVNEGLQDGMDVGICTIYHERKKIEFAGANRPLFFTQGDELLSIPPTEVSIGGNFMKVDHSIFKKHTISFARVDVSLYLFSDGFTEQKGGPNSKAPFGEDRLKDLIKEQGSHPLVTQAEAFDRAIERWRKEGQQRQNDDILIMGLKVSKDHAA